MQEEVARANAARRTPEATPYAPRVVIETPDGFAPSPEGFVSAPAAPRVDGKVEFASVDFTKGTIATTDGRTFPIEEEARKALALLCLNAMQYHFNLVVERMAKDYGVWVDAPATTAAVPTAPGTDASVPPQGVAATATSASPASAPHPSGAPPRRGRRGA